MTKPRQPQRTMRELLSDLSSEDSSSREAALAELRAAVDRVDPAFLQLVEQALRSPDLLAELRALPERLDAFMRLSERHDVDPNMVATEAWDAMAKAEMQRAIDRSVTNARHAKMAQHGRLPTTDQLKAELDTEMQREIDAGKSESKAHAEAIKTLAARYNVEPPAVRANLRKDDDTP